MFDDSKAREDWNWQPKYEIQELVDVMIDSLIPIYGAKKTWWVSIVFVFITEFEKSFSLINLQAYN